MWDKRYSNEEFVYGQSANDFLKQNIDVLPKGKVLCLAEGEGRNAVHLAKLGYQVTAVDLSAVGLKKAQRLAAEQGVEIETICADLADFEIEPGYWQGIVSIFCHLPSEIRRSLHLKVVNGLAESGVFLLEAYTESQIKNGTGGPPVADMMMSKDGLINELYGLKFQLCQEIERDVLEGSLHTGKGAVVQVIAKK